MRLLADFHDAVLDLLMQCYRELLADWPAAQVLNRRFNSIRRTAAILMLSLLAVALSGQAETVRFAHCLGGCPAGADTTNAVIARSLYTLSYNRQTRVADWVAYIVTPGSIGVASNLSRLPLSDPFVTDTLQPADFPAPDSGNPIALHYFAPLVSFAGTPYWQEVNYLTNVVPRNANLNRGSWYGLEWAVRNLANRSAGLYVITGPIYYPDKPHAALPSETPHEVPGGFFKVIANAEGELAAFVFDQDLPFHIHHCDQITTVAEVESLTGLDLFPELPDLPAGDLAGGLGCLQ